MIGTWYETQSHIQCKNTGHCQNHSDFLKTKLLKISLSLMLTLKFLCCRPMKKSLQPISLPYDDEKIDALKLSPIITTNLANNAYNDGSCNAE